jgi:3-oxoacyl-[acyl-carrier protein] reductase
MLLAGKTALITGAGRGIGRGIAERFAEQGCDIALAARTTEELEDVATVVQNLGRKAVVCQCDVTDEAQIRETVDEAVSGLEHIDILVNNAGYADFKPVMETSPESWQRTLDVNVTGPFRLIQAVVPDMIAHGSGRIINISSVVGIKAYANQGAYCASKHALNGLTQVLAMELREHGIGVHAVCPGGVPTRLTNENMPERDKTDWMTADDIAHACLYLATLSPRATTDILTVRRFASTP